MKRLLVMMLIVLFLVSVVDAQKKTTPTPAPTGPKITGVNNPATIGGGTGTTPTPGRAPTNQYYYVVGSEGYTTPDGTKLTTGATFTSDQPVVDPKTGQQPSGITTINADQYQFTKQYAGQYSYQGESKFTYDKTTTTQADNLFENYRTTTTVTITVDDQGNTHKTYDEKNEICGKGLTRCDGTYTEIKGSHITVDETYKTETKPLQSGQTGTPESRSLLTQRTTTLYDKDNKPQGTMTVTYMASDKTNPFSTRAPQDVTVKGSDDKIYYQATVDPDTGKTTIVVNNIDKMTGLSDYDKRQIRENIVATGALGFTGAFETLTFGQTIGRAMKAYYDYQGLSQLTTIFWPKYDEQVRKRREKIQQEFCLAAGITNCVTSTICGSIYKIHGDNILVGRGPGGQYVSSASLNAERSLPIEVEGMTRQQLIDLFGNATVIKGVLINLTDPNFDPRILGKLKLRLYHIQYGVTNNVESQSTLHYNIVFQKVAETLNSSYGTAVIQGRWWRDDQTLDYQSSARNDIYKFSGTEYNSVCMTFDPKLPSGHAAWSSLVGELCVPFEEYGGGPSEILPPGGAGPQGGGGGAPTSETPGALV